VILNNLVLPVVQGPLSLYFLSCVVNIFDVHPCVLSEVSHGKFLELLSKELLLLEQRILLDRGRSAVNAAVLPV